ncbi:hypothetical protein B0H14DRAFT_2788094 [Mycena olivaceomarginata]|nr:hypothetical protein B0H14DRAFT_2788094 [Mycena olivaceomarginata]
MWITGSRSDVFLPFDFDFDRTYTYAHIDRACYARERTAESGLFLGACGSCARGTRAGGKVARGAGRGLEGTRGSTRFVLPRTASPSLPHLDVVHRLGFTSQSTSPARCGSPLLCSHPRQSLPFPRLPLAPSTAPASTARRIHQYQGRRALPPHLVSVLHGVAGPARDSGATLSEVCARTRHTHLWNTIRAPCPMQHILARALSHLRLWILRSAPAAPLARCTSVSNAICALVIFAPSTRS